MYSLFVSMKTIEARLKRFCTTGTAESMRLAAEQHAIVGYETRTDPGAYNWPGERRGDPRHPLVLMQYTLDGWGAFESDGITRRVPAGSMFAAVLPSAHRYYLPTESPSWTFFWCMVRQPYLVERVRHRIARSGPVLETRPDDNVVGKLVGLHEQICRKTFSDVFAFESTLFDVVMAWERACELRTYPQSPRERLLDDVRTDVERRLTEPIDVESIAARYGMSRSGFTHHFKVTTGLSPGQFVTETKLREVTRRLQQSDDKLEVIASACGFADANHLCKVFRRFHYVSPGEYRRQFR